jgi:hypothetical protein
LSSSLVKKAITMAKVGRLLLIGAFVCAQPTVVSILLATRFNATLADCAPNRADPLFNDEVHYWNEVAAFAGAGFGGGYFVINEHPAPATWTHFGPHGPGFPVLYGSLARLFGWRDGSGPQFNGLVVLLGALSWFLLCRPDHRRLATATVLLASFWPGLLWLPATMQESLHLAIGLVLAGLASRALGGGRAGALATQLFFVVAAAGALIRVTWALVLVPLACVAPRAVSRRYRLLILAEAAATSGCLWVAYRWLCSPYPNDLASVVDALRNTPDKAFRIFFTHLQGSLLGLLSPRAAALEVLARLEVLAVVVVGLCCVLPFRHSGIAPYAFAAKRPRLFLGLHVVSVGSLYVLQTEALAPLMLGRYLYAVANAAALAGLFALHRDGVYWLLRRLRSRLLFCETDPGVCVFAALSLALVIAGVLVLYASGSWRDYRVLAPHLLLALFALAARDAWRFSLGVAVVNLLFTPVFLGQFDAFHSARFRNPTGIFDLGRYVEFDPGADPWSNTVLVTNSYGWSQLKTPVGIGVSFMLENGYRPSPESGLELPPRSRHLVVGHAQFLLRDRCRLELICETPVGGLYRNLDFRDNPTAASAHR